MEELIRSLPKILSAAGESGELDEAAALAAWKYVAGDGLRNHSTATALEDRKLIVAVRDGIWQKQLSLMKNQIIFRINSVLGRPIVRDIELRINPDLPGFVPNKTNSSEEITANEVPIDLWSAANAIEDKQLRQKFLKAAIGLLRRREREQ